MHICNRQTSQSSKMIILTLIPSIDYWMWYPILLHKLQELFNYQLFANTIVFSNIKSGVQGLRMDYSSQIIKEWQQAYIRWEVLSAIIAFLTKIFEKQHYEQFEKNHVDIVVEPVDESTQEKLGEAIELLKGLIQCGRVKYKAFTMYRLMCLQEAWTSLGDFLKDLESQQLLKMQTHQNCLERTSIKKIIKTITINLQGLRLFYELNQQIESQIKISRRKLVQPLQKTISEILTMKIVNKSPINRRSPSVIFRKTSLVSNATLEESDAEIKEQLDYLEQKIKNAYAFLVFHSEQRTSKLDNNYFHQKALSTRSIFLTGLYVGLAAAFLPAICIAVALNLFGLSNNDKSRLDSVGYIFPMFRGIALFILYYWSLAAIMFVFQHYKINYRMILGYGDHYSAYFQIVKRAGFFTVVFALAFLVYLIGASYNDNNSSTWRIPIEYCPILAWMFFFGYIFFPGGEMFNPQGRYYLYSMFKDILRAPLIHITFPITFVTTQFISLTIPFKDLGYTVCYLTSPAQLKEIDDCLNATSMSGFLITYLVAMVPLIIRMILCYKQAFQSEQLLGNAEIINFFRFLSVAVAVTASYVSIFEKKLEIMHFSCGIFSSAFCSYYDIKYDWGFLQPRSRHRFLRTKLSYPSLKVYYVNIIFSIFLRGSWILILSPSVTSLFPKSTFLPFLLGFLEIVRLSIWNCYKLERHHVENCKNMKITQENVDELLAKLQCPMKEVFSLREIGTEVQHLKPTEREMLALFSENEFNDEFTINLYKEQELIRYEGSLQKEQELMSCMKGSQFM